MKFGSMKKKKWFSKFPKRIHGYLVMMEDVIAQSIM